MILTAVLVIPFIFALFSLLIRNDRFSRILLFAAGAVELLLCSVLYKIILQTPDRLFLLNRFLGTDTL